MAEHYFVVTAFNAFNQESIASQEVSADTDSNPHALPCGFLIDWSAVSGATKYRVYHGVAEETYTEYVEVNSSTFSFEWVLTPNFACPDATVGIAGSPPVSAPDSTLTWVTSIGNNTGVATPTGGENTLILGDHVLIDRNKKLIFGTRPLTAAMAAIDGGSSFLDIAREDGAALSLVTINSTETAMSSSTGRARSGSLKVGSTYAGQSTSDGNAIISGTLAVGATTAGTKKAWVAGELFSTSLNVGISGSTAPANGILADNALIGTNVAGISWGEGVPELGVNGPVAIANTQFSGGLWLYQFNASSSNNIYKLQCESFSSPSRHTASHYLTAQSAADSYHFFAIEYSGDAGTPRTLARIVRPIASESSNAGFMQIISSTSDCYRWSTSTAYDTPTGTSEVFVINASGGIAMGAAAVIENSGNPRIQSTGTGVAYYNIPLKIPMGGTITNISLTYTNHTALANVPSARIFRRGSTSSGFGTQVGSTTNTVASTTGTINITGITSHAVVAGQTYYMNITISSNGAGTAGDLTAYQVAVTMTLDRHHPDWMG